MVKLLLVALYKYTGPDTPPVLLDSALDVSSFSYFTRGTISEHLRFGVRTVVQRTPQGQRQTITLKDIPYLVHAYVRHDGLCGACVSDQDYPQRTAYTFVNKVMQDYEALPANAQWRNATQDSTEEREALKAELTKFQDPHEADKLSKVQKELDQIKDIMHQNIDQIMKRGETLDSLMEKSSDLSATSVTFYKQAKRNNQCCKMY